MQSCEVPAITIRYHQYREVTGGGNKGRRTEVDIVCLNPCAAINNSTQHSRHPCHTALEAALEELVTSAHPCELVDC